MGELVQRADASKSVVEEAAMSLVSEVDRMTKQIGVFQDYIDEIRETGGSVGFDANGTGAAMVLETPALTEAVERQTESSRETRETFLSLQDKIDKEQSERTKKVDEFIQSLDEDRRAMAEDMRQRDEAFMDKLYSNVVRQGNATAQQDSFDRLVEGSGGSSTAERVMQAAGNASEVAQGATSIIGSLGAGGTRGIGTIANVLSKAGGVLKFLGPVGAVLGTAVAGLNLVEGGIDQFQGLRNASLEATGSTGNLNVGVEQGIQSKITEFTSNLSDKDVQTIQRGLMSGGATYGTETYGQGYDWVVGATQNRGLSAQAATDEYVKAVVKGGKSVDYLNEKFDELAKVAENTGASMTAINEQQQNFAKTFQGATGSSMTGDRVSVDFAGIFGDETGNSSKVANSLVGYAQNDVYFKQALIDAQNSGMDESQSYAYAMQQYTNFYSEQGSPVSKLVKAVMDGDREKFIELWNSKQNQFFNKNDAMKELSKVFFGGESIPVDQNDPNALFDFLSDPLVNDVNKALTGASTDGDEGKRLLEVGSQQGDVKDASYLYDFRAAGGGAFRISGGITDYQNSLKLGDKKGAAALNDTILNGDYESLSDEQRGAFVQSMVISGALSEDELSMMSEDDIKRMYGDVSWSYGTYGRGKTSGDYLEDDFEWKTRDQDWFSNSSKGASGEKEQYEFRMAPDAAKMFYLTAMEGKEQLQSDGDF